MPQDNKSFGKPGSNPNQPGKNPSQQPGKPGQNPGGGFGKNPPGGGGGQKPGQNWGGNKPQGSAPFTEQKGGSTWTTKEIEQFKTLVQQKTPVETISSTLGKSEDIIQAKAKELKLQLTEW